MKTSEKAIRLQRKRLYLRCKQRGTLEMGLILGRFADSQLHNLCEEDLQMLEMLLDEDEQNALAWIYELESAPQEYKSFLSSIRAATVEIHK